MTVIPPLMVFFFTNLMLKHFIVIVYSTPLHVSSTVVLSLSADRQTDASSHVISALPPPHTLRDVMEMNSAETV